MTTDLQERLFEDPQTPPPSAKTSSPPPAPRKKQRPQFVQIMVDRNHYDFIDKCYIEHKWIVIVPVKDVPEVLKNSVKTAVHSTLYMSEQDYLDVEVKLIELIKRDNRCIYIKSHGELISNVNDEHVRLPLITSLLQICVVPSVKSCSSLYEQSEHESENENESEYDL